MEEYKENYCSIDQAHEKVTTDGYCVIKDILNNEEIDNAKDDLWNTLNKITRNFKNPIKKSDPRSWKTYLELKPIHSMLLQNCEIGHAQFFWDIRQNKNVIDVFSKIWKVEPEDLLVSFDGLSFHVPPEITKEGWYEGNSWFHTDQAPNKKEFTCVQGMVTLYDINKGDATLRVLEKSCKYHDTIFDINQVDSNNNWHQYEDNEMKYFEDNKCKPVRVLAKAGDLILWDSRTAHHGIEPIRERIKQNFRAVTYVCMTPRYMTDEKNLIKKQNAFNNKRMTTHWPHKIKLFSKIKKDLNVCEIEKPKLKEIGEKLAGF